MGEDMIPAEVDIMERVGGDDATAAVMTSMAVCVAVTGTTPPIGCGEEELISSLGHVREFTIFSLSVWWLYSGPKF